MCCVSFNMTICVVWMSESTFSNPLPWDQVEKKTNKIIARGKRNWCYYPSSNCYLSISVERGNSRGSSDSGETLVQRLLWDKESPKSNKTCQYLSLSQKIRVQKSLSFRSKFHKLANKSTQDNSNTYFQEGNGVTGKSREGGGRAYPRTDGQLDWLNWALASRRRRRLFLSQPKSERQNYPAATNQHNTAFVLHTNTQARTHALPPPQTLQPYR